MATYIVGDIQGCYDELAGLLDQAGFDATRDHLWATGDLVNRGPRSLEVLRFFRQLGTHALTVLGNHDLHLLAIAHGCGTPRRGDTFDAILNAPDRDQLLHWLQRQPLLHYDRALDLVLCHAGIAPGWSITQAIRYAAEVEAVLASDQAATYFAHMYGNEPAAWDDSLIGPARWRVITNYCTRMRFVDHDGALDLGNKLAPQHAVEGTLPWFLHPAFEHAATDDERNGFSQSRFVFGHWASLDGRTQSPRFIALDTGCVWGGKLTALRADDGVLLEWACSTRQ